MKFKKVLMLSLVGMLALSGCSQKDDSKESEKKAMTVQQITQKVEDANKEIKSIKADLAIKMDIKSKQGSMATSSTGSIEMLLKPIKMHLNLKSEIKSAQKSAPVEMDMYILENDAYIKTPASGKGYQKLNLKDLGVDMSLYENMAKSDDQLKLLKSLESKMKVEETDKAYVLTYNGDGKDFNEILKTMPEFKNNPVLKGSNFEVKSFSTKASYDKKTFHPIEVLNKVEISVKAGEDSGDMLQETTMKYKELNTIEDIKVPETVK